LYAISPGLHVEWAKTCAGAHCWQEQILKLEEEMHQSIKFCWWRARWWRCCAKAPPGKPGHITEGIHVYAVEQSETEQQHALIWTSKWRTIRDWAQAILKDLLANGDTLCQVELVVEIDYNNDDKC